MTRLPFPLDAGLIGLIEHHALSTPQRIALMDEASAITYSALLSNIQRLAQWLHAQGIRPGIKVGMAMHQSGKCYTSVFALAAVGAICVPLPDNEHTIVQNHLDSFSVQYVLTDALLAPMQGAKWLQFPDLHSLPAHTSGNFEICRSGPFWMAMSSGSLGDPKGVLLSQTQLLQRVERSPFAYDAQSRGLPISLGTSAGLTSALRANAWAGCVVLLPTDSAMQTLELAQRYAITHMMLMPLYAAQLVQQTAALASLPNMQFLWLGGGACPAALFEFLVHRITPNVYIRYSASEVGNIGFASAALRRQFPDCAGRLNPWVQGQAVNEDDVPLPPGETGELRFQSPEFPASAENDPATKQRFRGGWFYPGDIGRIDAQGLIFIEGRTGDRIIVAGVGIAASTVEAVVLNFPGMQEAAVFPAWIDGTRPVLGIAVVHHTAIDKAALCDFLYQQISGLNMLQLAVVSLQALPRSPMGKIRRAQLPLLMARIMQNLPANENQA